ncbi:hypothetical protein K469DRAFT_278655 [Zopfia rhizophila CBS 207.26]|uniref:Uncharacterized protein n=1 Tax=Zopfia rhizophila CBS 207.26 TaxID=1314779 RepID=A0A6A6DLK2_9PEZI|nr:hypothetical protein K469DRAFT_278655 [Zopfia rhizophila CBS 207.26]
MHKPTARPLPSLSQKAIKIGPREIDPIRILVKKNCCRESDLLVGHTISRLGNSLLYIDSTCPLDSQVLNAILFSLSAAHQAQFTVTKIDAVRSPRSTMFRLQEPSFHRAIDLGYRNCILPLHKLQV